MIGIVDIAVGPNAGLSLCLSADITAEDVRDTFRCASEANHALEMSDIVRKAQACRTTSRTTRTDRSTERFLKAAS